MKRLLLLTFGLIFILGCHKSEEITPSPNIWIENHQVHLDSGNRITKITTTDANNKFMWDASYSYSDSLVIITKNVSVEELIQGKSKPCVSMRTYLTTYKIGQNGFAEYSIDTSFSSEDPGWMTVESSNKVWYAYDQAGYIRSSICYYDTSYYSSYFDSTHYTFLGGNLINLNERNSMGSMEQHTYSYYDTINKIDLLRMGCANGIAGKINQHLIKKEISQYGWPMTDPMESVYHYILNSDGYVTEQTMTTTSQYGRTTINIDRYTYIFN